MAKLHERLRLILPARSRSARTDESGFTLVEALVAMVVLTIGLVSLAELLAVGLRLQQLGRNETAAVRVAQDQLDELSAAYFGVVGTGVGADPRILIGGSLDSSVANYNTTVDGHTVRWLVTAGPDGDANLRSITIRVIPSVVDNRTANVFELVSIIRRI